MNFFRLLTFIIILTTTLRSQEIEVFLIDSYITIEKPHSFVLSFYTSEEVKSKLKFNGEEEIEISSELTDLHNYKLDLSEHKFDSLYIPFKILMERENGEVVESEVFETTLPQDYNLNLENAPGFITVCCFGGVIFGIPSPAVVFQDDNQLFGLSKEVPLFSFFAKGFNYPAGYISIEYSYVDGFDPESFFRVGYKHIIQTPFIEYISPGINIATNFQGFNGISPEISVGFVTIQNVFTLYSKYRYNTNFDESAVSFHEISFGLYSNFFSINF